MAEKIIDFLLELIFKDLAPIFDYLWNTISIWRVAALLLLMFVIFAWFYRKKLIAFLQKEQLIEHDLSIFNSSNQKLSERDLLDFLEQLGADHSYFQESRLKVGRYMHFFDEVGNSYLDPYLNKNNKEFLDSAMELSDFLMINFFVHPEKPIGNDLRLCLQPHLNIDRAGIYEEGMTERYNNYAHELNEHIATVNRNYRRFRLAIKKKLKV
jgi:hypothetical protein